MFAAEKSIKSKTHLDIFKSKIDKKRWSKMDILNGKEIHYDRKGSTLNPNVKVPIWYSFDSETGELIRLERYTEKINFDVAIVGTGASSLPIASHAKKLGKQGIHLGGATQILFGIKGKRWDNMKKVNVYYNEYWKRPSPEEIPEKGHLVEDGCYW